MQKRSRIQSVYNISFVQNIIHTYSVKEGEDTTIPKRKGNRLVETDPKMIQILELAGKEFKADITTMLKYVRVIIMKEKIGNMEEKLKLEKSTK